MSGLKKVLERSHANKLKAGGAISAETIANLRAYRKQQFVIFIVFELLLVAGVGVCAFYLTHSTLSATEIKVLASLIGVGTGGGLEVGRRIWKEWAQTDLVLALFSEATEAQVNATIDKLIKKL